MSFYDIALNIIIVSIPEIFCMIFIALLFMGRYDYFDKYTIKANLKKMLFVVVIPDALITSFLLYELQLNSYIRIFINFIVFLILMMILLRVKLSFKIIFSLMVGFLTLILTELLTGLILIYVFNLDFTIMNISPLTNFFILLPSRIVQLGIVYIFYLKKNSIFNIRLANIWISNLPFRKFTYLYIGFNILISFYLYNKFAVEKCIQSLDNGTQMFLVTLILILFVLEMISPWVTLYVIYPSEKYRNKIN